MKEHPHVQCLCAHLCTYEYHSFPQLPSQISTLCGGLKSLKIPLNQGKVILYEVNGESGILLVRLGPPVVRDDDD